MCLFFVNTTILTTTTTITAHASTLTSLHTCRLYLHACVGYRSWWWCCCEWQCQSYCRAQAHSLSLLTREGRSEIVLDCWWRCVDSEKRGGERIGERREKTEEQREKEKGCWFKFVTQVPLVPLVLRHWDRMVSQVLLIHPLLLYSFRFVSFRFIFIVFSSQVVLLWFAKRSSCRTTDPSSGV